MQHKAYKIVIITEKLITGKVAKVIEECGGTGYTITSAGGKGSRGVRSEARGSMTDTYANVKIEVILSDEQMARTIGNTVSTKYFDNYSGITYLEHVEIIRPQKF